jgi:hypothetical protein
MFKRAIVKVLQDIIEGNMQEPVYGLCTNVWCGLDKEFESSPPMQQSAADAWHEVQEVMYPKWPKYSGHDGFPVPATAKFKARTDTGNLQHIPSLIKKPAVRQYAHEEFKYGGEYGELRLELAQFIVNELKLEINHA